MRARLRSAVDTCADHGRAGYRRSRRGIVYFITSDKNIQAIKTAAAFGVIGTGINSTAELVNIVLGTVAGLRIPLPWQAFLGMITVFWLADYADHNTEAWRDRVEQLTGEEAADDEAEPED